MIIHRLTGGAFVALFVAMAALAGAGVRAAEVKPQYYIRGNQTGVWYKSSVKLPKGWVENTAWSQRYERVVLFENGDNSSAKPFMYVRVHPGPEIALETYIRTAQQRWLARLKDTTIEQLPDVANAGASPIKLYLYRNPSAPSQAFELTAFMKDAAGRHGGKPMFFQIVLAAPTQSELDRARPALMELLRNLQQ
ncbi:MAG: hypothetical protein AB7F96_09525 [Beijerinckiaceae bacterium]